MPAPPSQSSIEPPTAPTAATASIARAACSGAAPKPFSRSTETGRSLAATRTLDVLDHLVQRHLAVGPAEGEGEAAGGRRQRLEAERLEHPRAAAVPGVRDQEAGPSWSAAKRRPRSSWLGRVAMPKR